MSTSVMVKVFNRGSTSNKLYCMHKGKQKYVPRYKEESAIPKWGRSFSGGADPVIIRLR